MSFGPSESGSGTGNAAHHVWQDREIRFDVNVNALATRKGEYIIDSIDGIEDTKGNNGENGAMLVSNLRILWIAGKKKTTNLSIGFNTVLSITIRKAKSKLRGTTQALYIMTKFGPSRFEFIFTSLVKSPRLFTTVQAVLRAYETSKLYRDLKLRGSVVKGGQLVTLPKEQIYDTVPGVWNLSSEQGNLGTFIITNVRLVWHANLAQNFNVSIPYMQMKDIRLRQSKFGPAFVIETNKEAGGYILGFRIDPPPKLQELHKQVTSLHSIYAVNPVFGVDHIEEEVTPGLDALRVKRVEDGEESSFIDESTHEDSAAVAAYFADPQKSSDREIVFDTDIGLACEAAPEGTSISKLWNSAW